MWQTAAAQGGSEILGGFVNWAATAQQNKKSRQWNEKMMDKMNEYNSPKAQMERFDEAGLNPHLIYGQGTPGNQPSPVQGKFGLPPLPVPNMLAMYNDFRLKNAQIDHIKAMQSNVEQETVLKTLDQALKTMEIGFKPKYYGFKEKEMDYKTKTWPYNLEALDLKNKLMGQQIALTLERIAQTNLSNQWQRMKVNTFNESGLNIDRDDKWTRVIFQVFGEKLKNWFEKMGNKGWYPGQRLGF